MSYARVFAGRGPGLARVRALAQDAARTLRFVRGARAFQVRPDDVFLSSYPRSGTTWLQYLLHVLIHGRDTGFTHIAQVSPWYERSLARGYARAENFARLAGPRVFKSHLPYAWLPKGARYVYAVRDGRDVAVSYHQLYLSHLGSRDDFDVFFERFMRGRLQYGSWFDHVAAWQREAHRPAVHVVHYEQLSADLPRALKGLSAFLGLPRSEEELAEVARRCSFAAMRAEEHRFDHATAPEQGGRSGSGAFVREGRIGGYARVLSPAQRARFVRASGRPARGPRLSQLPAFLL